MADIMADITAVIMVSTIIIHRTKPRIAKGDFMKQHKKFDVLILYVEAFVLIFVIIFALINPREKVVSEDVQALLEKENQQPIEELQKEPEEVPQELHRYHCEVSDEVKAKLAEMTLEEKIAQMYIVRPEQLMNIRQVVAAGNRTRNAINQYPVGGFVYSELNFEDEEQTKELIAGVMQYAMDRVGIPMYLAIKEQGGRNNSPLAQNTGLEIQKSAAELAQTGDVTQAQNVAKVIGTYLKDAGLNMNFAPVTDLLAGGNTEYADVCFGDDAEFAKSAVVTTMKEYENSKITSVIRYFPEKTSASLDADTGLLTGTKTLEEHMMTDFFVCQGAVDEGAKAVMLSNVVDKGLTTDEVPASLSGDVVIYLRETMGFEGIVITDSLAEETIANNYTVEDATLKAFEAGVDIIYDPIDFVKSYTALLNAVQNGDITENEVDERVGRILTLKMDSME